MTVSEIRQKYIDFFKSRAHVVLPSASLVQENDPTTLFTGSGMQPMVPFLLGEPHPYGSRLADSQKCFRSQDIEEVGDNRHTTFFEMLGNWSLGDYFKREQIEWMFEFLTRELGLDPARLYVTVFAGDPQIGIPRDEETAALWTAQFSRVGIDSDLLIAGFVTGLKHQIPNFRDKIQQIFGNKVIPIEWRSFPENKKKLISAANFIINLSGANIGEKRWTRKRKNELMDSRINTTKALADACALSEKPPAQSVSKP